MLVFLKLIAAHIILQPDVLAKSKQRSFLALLGHSGINALVVYLLIGNLTMWWLFLVIFVSHFLIDYIKIRYGIDNVKWFIGDQVVHLSVLLIIWTFMTGDFSAIVNWTSRMSSSVKFWTSVIVYLAMLMPSSLLIERIFRKWI